MPNEKGRVGSSFEDYLAKEGILEETTATAAGRVLASQSERAIERKADDQKPEADESQLVEIDYLLHSPRNAERLREAIAWADAGEGEPVDVEALRRRLGLEDR